MRRQARRRRVNLSVMLLLLAFALLAEGLIFRAWPQESAPLPQESADYDHTADERELLLEARTWYGVQLGVYSTQNGAQAAQDTLPFETVQLCREGKYRLLCDIYAAKEEATARVTQIKGEKGLDACVASFTSPVLQLRLSGQKGQLDVIEAGLQFLPTAVSSLLAGENAAEIARQATLLCTLLESRFAQSSNTVLTGLAACYTRLCQAESLTRGETLSLFMQTLSYLEAVSKG